VNVANELESQIYVDELAGEGYETHHKGAEVKGLMDRIKALEANQVNSKPATELPKETFPHGTLPKETEHNNPFDVVTGTQTGQ
jgi:hypothetical protein